LSARSAVADEPPTSRPADKAVGVAVRAAEKLGADRRAVVIGINDYADARVPDLKFAESDARAVRDLLIDESIGGFKPDNVALLLGKDATTKNIKKALYDLRRVGEDELVVIYFSGHGAKAGGESFWITQDAELADLGPTALSNAELSRLLSAIPSQRVLTLLDCCYAADTVLNQKAVVSIDDLAQTFTGKGRVTIAGAGGGEEAIEVAGLKQGVFTHFLISGLRGGADANADGVVTLDELWRFIQPKVEEAARQNRGIQKPTQHMETGQQTDRFLLTLNPAAASRVVTRVAALRKLALDDKLPVELFKEAERLLASAPTSEVERKRREVYERLADEKTDIETAKLALAALSAPSPAPAPTPSPVPAPSPSPGPSPSPSPRPQPSASSEYLDLDCGSGVTMRLKLIPAGPFTMGSPTSESGRGNDETQHSVTISQPFYMGVYEVTQAQWQAVMGSNPSHFTGDLNRPVEQVSWNDCQAFCQKVSAKTGKTVRLPTEAEWEYACRAGSTGRYSFGDSDSALGNYAWYYDNSGNTTHPVGQKQPNAWGLYDMHGNVWEWCQDWYGPYSSGSVTDPSGPGSGEYRVLRGGSWYYIPPFCRAAVRRRLTPDNRWNNSGVRVVVSGASAGSLAGQCVPDGQNAGDHGRRQRADQSPNRAPALPRCQSREANARCAPARPMQSLPRAGDTSPPPAGPGVPQPCDHRARP
jgi:formylglycine-generating enzyme required for sulfatase activity